MRTPRNRHPKPQPATRRKQPRLPPASMDVETQARSYRLLAEPGSYTLSGFPAELKAVERDAMLKRLDAAEAALRELVPLVEQTKLKHAIRRRPTRRGEIGDNYPPDETAALDVSQITEGVDTIDVVRTELKAAAPRLDVLRVCTYVLKRLAYGVGVFGAAFAAKSGDVAAVATFPKVQATLFEIIEKITQWLHAMGLQF